MAQRIDPRLPRWVEATIEGWLGLTINREKTRIVRLTPESGATLDFLGYTFRYDRDRFGRARRYFTAVPSAKARTRLKGTLRAVINSRHNYLPVPLLIAQVNRCLRGWQQYFCVGYPQGAYRVLNAFVLARRSYYLHRWSQRPFLHRPRQPWYTLFTDSFGLEFLAPGASPR